MFYSLTFQDTTFSQKLENCWFTILQATLTPRMLRVTP